MSSQKSDRWMWISGVVLVLMVAVSLLDYWNSIEGSGNFIETKGKAVSARCEIFRTSTTSKGGSGSLVANPVVRYAFFLNGVPYEGKRYARSSKYAMGTPDQCEAYIRQFLGSTEVVVWADLEFPEFSVLNKDLAEPTIEYGFLLIGILIWVCAGYIRFRKDSNKR